MQVPLPHISQHGASPDDIDVQEEPHEAVRLEKAVRLFLKSLAQNGRRKTRDTFANPQVLMEASLGKPMHMRLKSIAKVPKKEVLMSSDFVFRADRPCSY